MKKQIFSKKKLLAAGYRCVNPGNARVHLWVKMTTAGNFLVGKGLIIMNGFAFAANAAYDMRLARAEAVGVLASNPKVKAQLEQVGLMVQQAQNGEPMVAGFWDSVKSFGKRFYKGVKRVSRKIGKSKIIRQLARSAGGLLKNPMIQKAGAMGLQSLGVPLPVAQMGTSMLGTAAGSHLQRWGSQRRRRPVRQVRRHPAGSRSRLIRRGRSRTVRTPPITRQLSQLGSRHAMSALQSLLPSSLRGRQGLGSVLGALGGSGGGLGGLGSIAKSLGIGGEAPRQLCAGYSHG